MATRLSPHPVPQLALECGRVGQFVAPALPGWRERLLRALDQLRGWRASPPAEALAVGYEALTGLDEHLLADIGAPESVRERARHLQDVQRQRVIDFEHGHRSIGDGRW